MTAYAFFQKKFVPMPEAKIGVMTQALHYGTALFEGIRGNWNAEKGEMYLFRLKEHYQRMHNGAKLLKISLDYSVEEMTSLTVELIRKNGL